MTSQFLSSQLKPKRDNENCSLGAIFLSHVGLKVEFPFFSLSWKGTISWETAFFCGCAARLHLKSFPFNKQTNTFQGRSGLKGALRVGRKKNTSNAGDSKQLTKKKIAAGEERNPNPKKEKGRRKKKKQDMLFCQSCARACVLESPRFRPTPVVLAPRSEKKVTRYRVCDM